MTGSDAGKIEDLSFPLGALSKIPGKSIVALLTEFHEKNDAHIIFQETGFA